MILTGVGNVGEGLTRELPQGSCISAAQHSWRVPAKKQMRNNKPRKKANEKLRNKSYSYQPYHDHRHPCHSHVHRPHHDNQEHPDFIIITHCNKVHQGDDDHNFWRLKFGGKFPHVQPNPPSQMQHIMMFLQNSALQCTNV